MKELEKAEETLLGSEEAYLIERGVADRVIKESHSLLYAVVEGIPMAVYVKDLQGRYLMINTPGARLVGKAVEEVIGRDDTALYEPETARHIMETDRRVMASGKAEEYEHVAVPMSGASRFFLTTKAPYRGPLGTMRGVLGISRDITERKQAEQALKQNAARLQTLSRRMVEVQEEERRRLAHELHDGICQTLTCLALAFETGTSTPAGTARLLLDEAMAQLRQLSFDLRPALLDQFGLLAALNSLIENYRTSKGMCLSFNHSGLEKRLPPELETAGYRIVQEALTNIARHAGVREAAVRIWVEADTLQIQVEDEGVGFDHEAMLAESRSNGLPGLHERALLLGGRLVIESVPGHGTHLMAELPLGGPSLPGGIDEHFHCPGG